MRINVRRGLFRLWVILACLWAIIVVIASNGAIREEFKKASVTKELPNGFTLLVPVDCSAARGTEFADYSKDKDGRCWYEIPKFRAHYAEYKDLKDDQLSERLYEKAGIPLTAGRPWAKVMQTAGIAVGVPIAVFMLTWCLLWAFAGFRPSQL